MSERVAIYVFLLSIVFCFLHLLCYLVSSLLFSFCDSLLIFLLSYVSLVFCCSLFSPILRYVLLYRVHPLMYNRTTTDVVESYFSSLKRIWYSQQLNVIYLVLVFSHSCMKLSVSTYTVECVSILSCMYCSLTSPT